MTGVQTCALPISNIIPSRREGDPRTLILCFDGTKDEFDQDNSNIVDFVKLLAKKDRKRQTVYYQVRDRQPKMSRRLTDTSEQTGIGTSTKSLVSKVSPTGQ